MSAIPIVFLMGPTASGKTDLAAKISEKFPCEIISVDSVMIYQGLDIGSAKPDKKVLQKCPHHLIDILPPTESYSAANFRIDALRLIKEIHDRENLPLLTGGTMLYFRALQRGLSKLPSANPAIRKKLNGLAHEKGWKFMHAQLAQIDPSAAARIHPNDPQRIQRALEIHELTGIPMSVWQAKSEQQKLPWRIVKLALIPQDRSLLHQKITQRFDRMLVDGFMTEMQSLYQHDELHANLPSMRAVGYRQAWRHLAGEFDLKTMREKAIIATRQLAKRQLTWLRSEAQLTSITAEQYDIHDICHKIHSHIG